jgi:N-acetylglucosamine-6-sulfatase
VDDLRWNALGCVGHPFVKTPNIDRLAREGALFRNAFVVTPLCSPSRASFLTGQYAHTHGVVDNTNHDRLSHGLDTFPRRLQGAGYETAFVGKWHMGNDDAPRPGFDRWVSFKGQGDFNDPVLNEDGQARQVVGYMTDLLNDRAVAFLQRKRDRPFALVLAHKGVHGPFTPAERHKELYKDDPIPRPANADDDYSGKPMLRRPLPEPPRKATSKPKAKAKAAPAPVRGAGEGLIRQQLRCLRSIDEGVGAILKTIDALGRRDDTVVIFTSDNGYFWGDHGLGDKRAAYEESIRIPLLIRHPARIKPGTVRNDLVLNLDLAPTALDLAGLAIPKSIQGRSLTPLCEGEPGGWRGAFLAEYIEEPAYPRIATWQAVRTGRWKLIHYPGLAGMDELYDLEADPIELNNQIADPSAQSTRRDLEAELERLRRETGLGGPG